MSNLVKIYYVISTRNRHNGGINYRISDNFAQMPRGARRVYGTGHYNLDVVKSRLRKCEDGTFFKEQHKERAFREREDAKFRKRLHAKYLKRLKRAKS